MDWISTASQSTIVLAFVGAVFSYVVLRPLNSAIRELRSMIREIRVELHKSEEKRQEMDKRLVRVEESAKSAHHRMDGLEGVIRDIEK